MYESSVHKLTVEDRYLSICTKNINNILIHDRSTLRESDLMKIATYNVWNSDRGMPERENQIIDEVNALESDIIVLQEVRDKEFNERLLQGTNYKNYCFAPHEGRVVTVEPWRQKEGLAVYSKHPIKYTKYSEYVLFVVVEHMGSLILLVNVHLQIGRASCRGRV